MSRIGRMPITVPAGVEVTIAENNVVTVKGPKGTLVQALRPEMILEQDGNVIHVKRPSDDKLHCALHGMTRALLHNMVVGVSEGFKKELEINGVGYRAEKKGNELKTRLLDVMDRDTEAFNVVSAAFGMPKATDEEKAARSAAIQEGLKGCTKTPMEMMELIDETLTLAQSLLGRFNDTSASDLGVAFLSLKAGIQGAWLNVLINVGSLKDQEFAAEYRAKGEKLLAHALPLADECYAEIVKLIEG